MKHSYWQFLGAFSLLIASGPAAQAYDPLKTEKEISTTAPAPCSNNLAAEKPLALSEAVNLALCNNPQTREAWANVLAGADALGSARAAYLPTVNGTAGLQRSVLHGTVNDAATTASPAVSLDYLLFDFGARSAAEERTRQALISADYTRNSTLQNIIFAAVQSYYQLLSAQATTGASAETLTAAKASLEAATVRHEVGSATIADQLQAETAYRQADLQSEQSRNQEQIAKGILANVMGVRPDTVFTLQQSPSAAIPAFQKSIADMMEQAKKQRPDIASAAADLAASRENIQLQKANGLPTLSFSSGFERDVILSSGRGYTNDSTIGVTLHVPFFTGFDRTYQMKAAEHQAEAASARLAETEDAALLDVWRSYNNFDTTQHTLTMTDALMASAVESQDVALGRYKEGAGNITDLLNAQAQLANAREQRIAAEYGLMIAKMDLLRAIGTLGPSDLAGTPETGKAQP
jgi:TolC family type I secretion outer membrane protein